MGGMDAVRYTIRIDGHLGATVLSAFPTLAPQHRGPQTVLTGLLDQSALYGVLAEIEALGHAGGHGSCGRFPHIRWRGRPHRIGAARRRRAHPPLNRNSPNR